jgi:hypothetical protein
MLRFSIWIGNLITISGTALGLILAYLINVFEPPIDYIFAIISFTALWFFPHCLAHYIVGRLLGIKFRYYFVGRSAIRKLNLPFINILAERLPVLGIKIEREILSKVIPIRRLMMFLAGALASILLPFLPSLIIFLKFHFYGFIFILLAFINFGFTLYFSFKVGDVRRGLDSLSI